MSPYEEPKELRNSDNRVIARVARIGHQEGNTADAGELTRYTAYLRWPEYGPEIAEEIDLDAINEEAAWELARLEVRDGYQPGGEVVRVDERFGMYM